MENAAIISGYAGVVSLSLRLVPQLTISIYHNKAVEIPASVLVLEFLTCGLFIFHAYYLNILVMLISNLIVSGTVVVIYIHNTCRSR